MISYLSRLIKLKQVCLFVILVFIAQPIYLADLHLNNNLLAVSDINTQTIKAAKDMLNREIGNWKGLENLGQSELTKKLNAIVYNFCKNPEENTSLTDINTLFKVCETACGGRSYVLRGLLAVYGIESKYQNIYNIPIQGNHTGVEAKLRDNSIFLDPTFGTFFTRNNMHDTPMRLDDVKFSFDANKLPAHVYQAKKIKNLKNIPSAQIESLYAPGFKSDFLALSSYVNHEASSSPNDKNILYLSANLYLENNQYELGCLDALTSAEASSCFLERTNQLYSTSPPEKQISYNFGVLGYSMSQFKVSLFNFNHLLPGRYYVLTLLIYNKNKTTLPLNLTSIGEGVVLSSDSKAIMTKPGLLQHQFKFKARKSEGTLSLYSDPGLKYTMNLYGMKIEGLSISSE